MVPEGWQDGLVSDLLDRLDSGVSVNGEDRPLRSGEYGVLRVSSVTYGTFNPKAVKAIIPEDIHRARRPPCAGQIIISRSNTEGLVGASAYIDKDYPNLFLSDKLWQTVPKPNASMKWLSYVLASDHTRYLLSNLATGTSGSMKNITKDELLSLKISIPPASQQKKISQILSTWDQAITATERLLENSQQRKKALMQQLLTGKKRLSGFEGEWRKFQLSELEDLNWIELGRGKVISKKDTVNNPGHYPIYSSSIKSSGYMGAYGEFMFDEELISWSVDGGGNFFHRPKHKFSVTNVSGYMKLDTEKLCYKFLAEQLAFLHERLAFNYQTKAHPSVIRKLFHVSIPSLTEQRKIAEVLATADAEVVEHGVRLSCLNQEKKALMQQLLTGKIRVKVTVEEAA